MGATYGEAGVDVAAGEAAVERIRDEVRSTYRPEVLGDIGSFGGLFARAGGCRRPGRGWSTGGGGTKAMVGQAAGRLDTIGIGLVAMCVDAIVCRGAHPLFLRGY